MEIAQQRNQLVKAQQSIAQRGFTLIELIIVIIIISILAAYAIARWPSAVNLNAQAEQLAAAIRYTQSLAMTKGARYLLTITTSNKSYAITSIGSSPTTVNDPITNNTSTILGNGISFGTITGLASVSPYYIAFNGYGLPFSDNTATTSLTTTAVISLTSGGSSKIVQITPAGQVTAL